MRWRSWVPAGSKRCRRRPAANGSGAAKQSGLFRCCHPCKASQRRDEVGNDVVVAKALNLLEARPASPERSVTVGLYGPTPDAPT